MTSNDLKAFLIRKNTGFDPAQAALLEICRVIVAGLTREQRETYRDNLAVICNPEKYANAAWDLVDATWQQRAEAIARALEDAK